jgi:hypothetical protein
MKQAAILAAAGIFVICTSALAQEAVNSGYNVFTCEVSVLQLDEGHSLVFWKGKGVTVTDARSPVHMSHLECFSTTEIMSDKSFKSSGYCSHTDRDGDKWIDRNWNDSTMKKGRWEMTGVSGKYKGAHGTGSFVPTDLSSESACMGVSNWEADS